MVPFSKLLTESGVPTYLVTSRKDQGYGTAHYFVQCSVDSGVIRKKGRQKHFIFPAEVRASQVLSASS